MVDIGMSETGSDPPAPPASGRNDQEDDRPEEDPISKDAMAMKALQQVVQKAADSAEQTSEAKSRRISQLQESESMKNELKEMVFDFSVVMHILRSLLTLRWERYWVTRIGCLPEPLSWKITITIKFHEWPIQGLEDDATKAAARDLVAFLKYHPVYVVRQAINQQELDLRACLFPTKHSASIARNMILEQSKTLFSQTLKVKGIEVSNAIPAHTCFGGVEMTVSEWLLYIHNTHNQGVRPGIFQHNATHLDRWTVKRFDINLLIGMLRFFFDPDYPHDYKANSARRHSLIDASEFRLLGDVSDLRNKLSHPESVGEFQGLVKRLMKALYQLVKRLPESEQDEAKVLIDNCQKAPLNCDDEETLDKEALPEGYVCHNCGGSDHFRRECPYPRSWRCRHTFNGGSCAVHGCKFIHPPQARTGATCVQDAKAEEEKVCWYQAECRLFECSFRHPKDRVQLCQEKAQCRKVRCTLLHPRARPRTCRNYPKCSAPNCKFFHGPFNEGKKGKNGK